MAKANRLYQLSEADLDRRIARYEFRPSSHQRAGGAAPGSAWLIMICAGIGMWASISLLVSEKHKLSHPNASLLCDVNPLVGCGEWVGAWQNEVFFGISNSVLGLAFFAGITALGVALVSRAQFASWLWQALTVALGAGIIWICWFMYESFFVEGTLCPYCVVTWFVTITLFVHVSARSMQAGHWGARLTSYGCAYARNRWVVTGLGYGVVIALILGVFWNQLSVLFS